MANTETTVNELVINQLSKTKYEELKSAGSLQENQLYMVDEVESTGGVSSIGGVSGDITLGDGLSMDGSTLKSGGNNPTFHSSLTLDNNVSSGEAYRLVVYGATADGVQFNLQKYNATDNSFIENTSYMTLKPDGIYFKDSKISGGGSVSGDYLPLSGGTLTGNLIVKQSYLQAYYAGTGLGLVGNQILSQTINDDGSYSNVAQFKFDANGIEDIVNHKTFATKEYVDSKVPNIVASSTEPESPVEGMIWIQISE